jgi:hypothetical protein
MCSHTSASKRRQRVGRCGLQSYRKGEQREEHVTKIRKRYGYGDITKPRVGFRMTRWLYGVCWTGTERLGALFDRATAWLEIRKFTHALRRIMELRGRSLSLVMAPPVFSSDRLRRGFPDRVSPGAAFGAVRVPQAAAYLAKTTIFSSTRL